VLYPRPLTSIRMIAGDARLADTLETFVQYQLTPSHSITITTRWTPAVISLEISRA